MKDYNTPGKNPLLVAFLSATVFLLTSIPALAVFQPGAVRSDGAGSFVTPQSIRKQISDITVNTVANRPPAKPAARPDPKALHAASLRGDLRMVQKLVKERVNIHYMNSDRETALHMAASRGHLPIVIFLLNNGAHLNARTRGNWIALHHAVRFNRQKVANYLMAKGSPTRYKTSDGLDSMDIALAMGNQRMINLVSRYMHR